MTAGAKGAGVATVIGTASGGSAISAVAKLGLTTVMRFNGAANIMVATAAASLMDAKAPPKMRRVVESTLFLYSLAIAAVAFAAQRGGLWNVAGKWLALAYGGFSVAFFGYCLFTE